LKQKIKNPLLCLITENSLMELMEDGNCLTQLDWTPLEACLENNFSSLCLQQSSSFANDIFRVGAFMTYFRLEPLQKEDQEDEEKATN
jgi:hypothetical protein